MDRQPHNNLWAEKLLQVSMPDSGETWAGMEAILDRELPQRFWSDRRRWLLVILLLLLLIGVCNCPGRGRLFHSSGHDSRATGAHPANPGKSLAPAAHGAMPANPTTPAPAGATPAVPDPEPNTLAARRVHSGPLPPASVTGRKHNRSGSTDSMTRPVGPALAVTPPGRLTRGAPGSTPRLATPGKTTSGSVTPAAHGVTPAADHGSHRRRITASHHRPRPVTTPMTFGDTMQTAPDGSSVAKNSARPRLPAKSTGKRKIGPPAAGDTATTGDNDSTGGSIPAGSSTITGRNAPRGMGTRKNVTAVRDTTAKRNMTAVRDTAGKKNVTLLPKAAPRKDSIHKKPPPPPPQEQDEKEKDHGWVFGIGLNQFFPIGGQRGSTYNTDGLTGTLSDYLPVPMIRYYLNQKAYLQVEAQLNTPQATKKNLVFNSPVYDSTSISGERVGVTTSATLQQLYYFNFPLSFHYAVTDDLNIGTGLQFSHLSNAIGNFDSTVTNLTTLEVTNPKDTKSFKDDTLYRRIKTNEFRFLIDASYTWKHLVVGVRYNQALTRFIDIQLPTGGSTQSRNSSLQLYLRYILWDTRKKKKQGPP